MCGIPMDCRSFEQQQLVVLTHFPDGKNLSSKESNTLGAGMASRWADWFITQNG
ncbi:MAG: hypothetical protein MK171_11045 [Pirellulales bacterium]|nr:hypothetical protein [Pirellulales bacterium]